MDSKLEQLQKRAEAAERRCQSLAAALDTAVARLGRLLLERDARASDEMAAAGAAEAIGAHE